MGIFDGIRKRATEKVAVETYFKMLNAYAPVYSTFSGSVYEMALTRASVHAFASHCGKLQPKVVGTARRDFERTLQFKPNPLMDTYSFLYKLATIVKTENTAFIIPLMDDRLKTIGLWPERAEGTEIKTIDGVQYLLYRNPVNNGQTIAIEFDRVGVLRNHYYKSALYGESNSAIGTTLNLMHTNDQGIINGIKNSAMIRFIARLSNVLSSESRLKERKNFVEENLSSENNGGVMLLDSKYADVKQVEAKQVLVDPEQLKLIQTNVFNYFGVNEKILQNSFNEEEWNAYYEGAIEPFAIQLSLVLTNMVFRDRQLANSNSIMFESSRLAYASNTTKISLVTQLFDRGFITQNQGLEIFNLSPVEDGDKRWIRREYVEVDKIGDEIAKEAPLDDDTGQGIPNI